MPERHSDTVAANAVGAQRQRQTRPIKEPDRANALFCPVSACSCGSPCWPVTGLRHVASQVSLRDTAGRLADLWRYHELLSVCPAIGADRTSPVRGMRRLAASSVDEESGNIGNGSGRVQHLFGLCRDGRTLAEYCENRKADMDEAVRRWNPDELLGTPDQEIIDYLIADLLGLLSRAASRRGDQHRGRAGRPGSLLSDPRHRLRRPRSAALRNSRDQESLHHPLRRRQGGLLPQAEPVPHLRDPRGGGQDRGGAHHVAAG